MCIVEALDRLLARTSATRDRGNLPRNCRFYVGFGATADAHRSTARVPVTRRSAMLEKLTARQEANNHVH